jgi:hypothetical protein
LRDYTIPQSNRAITQLRNAIINCSITQLRNDRGAVSGSLEWELSERHSRDGIGRSLDSAMDLPNRTIAQCNYQLHNRTITK